LATGGEGGVAARGRYQGHGIGLVDDKGRVAIPSALRATLQVNAPRADGKDGGAIVIAPHESNECLVAYDPAYTDILGARLDQYDEQHFGAADHDDANYTRQMFSGEQVPFDGSGRFIMPAFERDHAHIGQYAFFVGSNNRIEIWDPATAVSDPKLADIIKKRIVFLMKERGVQL
jgi:MraZ protein